MTQFIQRIAMIEVPVSNLQLSIHWYERVLGLKLSWKGDNEATIDFPNGGSPSLFLVQTEDEKRLTFHHSKGNYENDIVDFYTPDLVGFHNFLKEQGVYVSREEVEPRGGFGFKDPDGNYFGAFNND
jgi:catechol 2,3-dioxygenase-like lactoylglutathione lyase family enzyme